MLRFILAMTILMITTTRRSEVMTTWQWEKEARPTTSRTLSAYVFLVISFLAYSELFGLLLTSLNCILTCFVIKF